MAVEVEEIVVPTDTEGVASKDGVKTKDRVSCSTRRFVELLSTEYMKTCVLDVSSSARCELPGAKSIPMLTKLLHQLRKPETQHKISFGTGGFNGIYF
jgi:hypothetical protein